MSATCSAAFGGSVIWFLWLLAFVVAAHDVTTSQLLSTRVLETKKTSTNALRTYIKKSEIKKRHRGLETARHASTSDLAKRRLEDRSVVNVVRRRSQSTDTEVSRELGLGEQRGSRRKRIFYDIEGKGSYGKGGKGKGGEGKGGKGKGGEGKGGKGKGGGKGGKEMKSSKGKGKGKKGKGVAKFCKELDFGGGGKGKGKGKGKGMENGKGKGKGKESKSKGKGKGKGKGGGHYGDDDYGYGDDGYSGYDDDHRKLTSNRSLQFDGELCDPNALAVAYMNPDLSIFVDLIKHANLDEIFSCAGPFTVLAPSNAAFNKNPELLQSLFNPRNIDAVQELLLYHILPGLTLTEDFAAGPIETLLGEDVDVTLEPLLFNNAGVVMGDVLSCNGVIHIIDNLLIPPGKLT